MKVFTPENDQLYHIGITEKEVKMESSITKKITHKIKGGETLSGIARKYNTTVVEIKKLNKLKNNLIQTGKMLSIPTAQRVPAEIPQSLFTSIDGKKTEDFYEFNFERELDKIYFYAGKEVDLYDLNGIVLENDKPGIVYHSIGVNGARFSDYNKYPLFFKQLKGLKPDLLVVSLGTNEAFDRMSSDEFQTQVNLFVKNVKANNPDVDILLTTPPPSYFTKGKPNTVASELTNELIINGIDGKYAIWDMYYYLGATLGLQYLQDEKMLAKDLVHYTVKGYEYTGDLFFESVMHTYSKFNQTEKQRDQ
jgi:LysM repeat protein